MGRMDKITKEWFDSSTVELLRAPELAGWHTDAELIRLSGAPRGSRVSARVNAGGAVELRVSNPDILREDMVRLVVQEADGYAFHIVNAVFVLNGDLLGKGIGPRSVTIEVMQAKQLAYIMRVRTFAVGNKHAFDAELPLRGYYVWPLMGFDAAVPAALLSHPDLPRSLPPSPTLLQLFQTERGEAFWLEHGESLWVEFDLKDGSASWERHRRYTAERRIEVRP